MRTRFFFFPLVILLLLAAVAMPAERQAEPAKEAEGFVRLRRDKDDKPVSLDTAMVTFVPAGAERKGVSVDLVGAIHVADKAYYDDLNRRFRKYDAVLYELVARENENVPRPGATPGSAIGGLQVGMKSLLDLHFQLDCIDYRRPNMIHADMSPEEFSATMKRRDESFTGMFFRLMGRSLAQQAKKPADATDLQLLAALFAPDRAHRLKLVMAAQFSDMESEMDVLDGPDGSTIITERNKKAFSVLSQQLDRGAKRIAVFYGAGHLADMQRRLEKDFGMKRTRTQWLAAWSLEAKRR